MFLKDQRLRKFKAQSLKFITVIKDEKLKT